MGTIVARKRKDGTIGYTAQIRIKRSGLPPYTESRTFDKKAVAQAWMTKREAELQEPGAIAAALNPEPILADVINRYLDEMGAVSEIGSNKWYTLKRIAASELGQVKVSQCTSQALVDFARRRVMENGVKPSTVNGDLMILRSVFNVAEPAWGYKLDPAEMQKAQGVSKQLKLIERADERDRVPTMEELNDLMRYFWHKWKARPYSTPMIKIVPFAIFTTRRQEEIIRLRWDDINYEEQKMLVRDVKHPRKKKGNHQWFKLTDYALEIIMSMPKVSEFIFPFETDGISAAFTRACDFLGIEDLRFHDLRRAGVSWLFEMGWGIPQVTQVSLHRDWNMLRRYTNLKKVGDRYKDWKWRKIAVEAQWDWTRSKHRKMRGAIDP